MAQDFSDLSDLGWQPFFNAEVDPDDVGLPARVMSVHRAGLNVLAPGIETLVPPYVEDPADPETAATVGDWLLLDPDSHQPRRLLPRKSVFKRRAAGHERKLQLIAANVDTLFIVTSCNQDFNIARLERYLALAKEADVMPVVVLTKPDLTAEAAEFRQQATRLMPGLLVEMLDARAAEEVAVLAPWCGRGQTVALLGSSGVGKSTLVNTLTDGDHAATQEIRVDDAKGRHTTTSRELHRLPDGGWLLDTPGMRELQLTDVRAGVGEVFADIEDLAAECRFGDCRHDSEPACAVRAAIETGTLDPARLQRWRKLIAEDLHNTETLHQKRARSKQFGKMVKKAMNTKNRLKR